MPPQTPPIHPKSPFTIVELLVVIVILSILASLLLPALHRAKQMAKLAVCNSNIRQHLVGGALYANDNNSWYPDGYGVSHYDNTTFAKRGLLIRNVAGWYNQGKLWLERVVSPGPRVADTVDGHTLGTKHFLQRAEDNKDSYVKTFDMVCPLDYERRKNTESSNGNIAFGNPHPHAGSIEYLARFTYAGYLGYNVFTGGNSEGKAIERPATAYKWPRSVHSGSVWIMADFAATDGTRAFSAHEGNGLSYGQSTFNVGHLDGHVDKHGLLGSYHTARQDIDTEDSAL